MTKLSIKEITVFALLGALMYITKVILQVLPNVHLLGVFTIAITVVYRKKALYPIYTYVLLEGIFAGFAVWWIPYLYLWLFLWGGVMLLPQNMNKKIRPIVYMACCGLHGLLFGTLYAPFQAIAFGLGFKGMIAWVVAGFPYDLIHGISNFLCGILIAPIISLLNKVKSS